MKVRLLFMMFCALSTTTLAQSVDAKQKIERACLDYLEGFYEGDTVKLIRSLSPALYKFGYWKNKAGEYEADGQMTYRQAVDYATKVLAKKNFAKADAPKKVEVLDMMDQIAAAKVSAWWGWDYILLARHGDKWIIEQVLWQGPIK